MIRAVLDTNVWLSGLLWKGAPNSVLRRGTRGLFVVITSQSIIDEVAEKLVKKFRYPDIKTHRLIRFIERTSVMTQPSHRLDVVTRDPTDNKIIECAVAGKADYVVTGDRDLLDIQRYRSIEIITPSTFLKTL